MANWTIAYNRKEFLCPSMQRFLAIAAFATKRAPQFKGRSMQQRATTGV